VRAKGIACIALLALLLGGCGGGDDSATTAVDPTSPEGAFGRFNAAANAGDGAALLKCIHPEELDETIAGYAAMATAFSDKRVVAAKLNPLLKSHGVVFTRGWAARGALVEPVKDKGALLTDLLSFIRDRRLVYQWFDVYGEIPKRVDDGVLMPIPWTIQKAEVTSDKAEVTAMTRYRKQGVRCVFELRRCGETWCLTGPKHIWEMVKGN
jgi:hypothetical protein